MAEHSWLDEHVELYAINALDHDEVERLERELARETEAERSRYLREIGRTREALAQMSAADETAPPPHLREALLAALPSALPEAGSAPNNVVDLAARRRRLSVAIGAVAAALILVIGGVMVGRVTAPDEKAPVASAIEQQTMQVLGASDVQVKRDTLSDGGTVIVAASRDVNKAVVIAEGLPPTPAGSTYQMWLLGEDHDPTSVGTMGDEPVRQAVPITDLTGSDRIAVTIEPEGGSAQPTGEAVTTVPF
jgi:anti-sigma-K factor RskA